MIDYVTWENAHEFGPELAEMHRLRYRVFYERLGWDVPVEGDQERDEFDTLPGTSYLMYRGADGRVRGCARLLATTGPNMLRDVFPELLCGTEAPCAPRIWESTRFAVDDEEGFAGGTSRATYELLAGMTEVGIAYGVTEVISVCDVRVERILKQTGLPVERIGRPRRVGNTIAVAGFFRPHDRVLGTLQERGRFPGSVLCSAPWIRMDRAA